MSNSMVKIYHLGGGEYNAMLIGIDGQLIMTDFDGVHSLHHLEDKDPYLIRRGETIKGTIERGHYKEMPLMEFLSIDERKYRSVNNMCLLIRSMKGIGYDAGELESRVNAIDPKVIGYNWKGV